MSKQQFLYAVIIALISGFSSAFFRNVMDKFLPDKDVLKKAIIRFVEVALGYGMPVGYLLFFAFSDTPLNKLSIIAVGVMCLLIVLQFLSDLLISYVRLIRSSFEAVFNILGSDKNEKGIINRIDILQKRQFQTLEELAKTLELVRLVAENKTSKEDTPNVEKKD